MLTKEKTIVNMFTQCSDMCDVSSACTSAMAFAASYTCFVNSTKPDLLNVRSFHYHFFVVFTGYAIKGSDKCRRKFIYSQLRMVAKNWNVRLKVLLREVQIKNQEGGDLSINSIFNTSFWIADMKK